MEQCAFLLTVFTLILTMVNAREGVGLPLMGEHMCYQDSYVADGTSFRWSKRLNPGEPSRTYLYGDYPYAFSKTIDRGQTLYMHGKVNDKFSLNLMGGVPMITDCNGVDVLHMVITFNIFGNPKDMALNTWKECKWMKGVHFDGPFRKGQSFKLALYAGDDSFELRVNGKKYVDYPYRVPLDMVNFINVNGGVTLSNIYIADGYKFRIPYFIFFDGKYKIGDRLILTGIDTDIDFYINIYSTKEIGYRFQLMVEFDKQLITRNTQIKGVWGEAETGGGFPLRSTDEFKLDLVHHANAFEIFLNDKWFASFKHRHPEGSKYDYNTLFYSLELKGYLQPRSLVICKNQP
uniref:Galectin n=1 Tax=Panagrellus redivivus TaxID=6233 RepID=A0A7E4V546_PANRE